MVERGVTVSRSGMGHREINQRGVLARIERARQVGEGDGQVVDCVRHTEPGEGVVASAFQVGLTEDEKRHGGVR